jgi:hypothetical protein
MTATHLRLVHRLIHWRYGISHDTVLNGAPPSPPSNQRDDAELKAAMSRIKAAAFTSTNGQVQVDYSQLQDSDVYAAYRECARRLQTFEPAQLATREEKLAFWINIYNALLIDAVIAFDVQRSVRDVPGFFWRGAYNINGLRFSANDIEHGILRANAGHPAIPGPQFSPRDPRLVYALDTLDPRVHFALVCASHSCPPVTVYDETRIDQQLDLAAQSFVNGGSLTIDEANNTVHLSRIFQWYAPDFGGSVLGDVRPILDYATPYLSDVSAREWLTTHRDHVKTRYQQYDWTLNGIQSH